MSGKERGRRVASKAPPVKPDEKLSDNEQSVLYLIYKQMVYILQIYWHFLRGHAVIQIIQA